MKNYSRISILLLFTLLAQITYAQLKKTNPQILVGFYNCENYYDTINQANVVDEDFLPFSEKQYNQAAYEIKSARLANVLYQLGAIENVNGFALMGLAEIENKMVLQKLTSSPQLKKYHYKFIHFDSKDARGVDVALIYNPAQFTPYQYMPYSLTDATHFNTYATRDILYVKGKLIDEWVHVLVNHWPSRRGGERSSASKRIWASSICKQLMDSVQKQEPNAKFIVMGDFNDNPSNKSLQNLKMENPYYKLFKNGIGSLAYNDAWNLFDQILLSPKWKGSLLEDGSKFSLSNYKPIIYNNSNMIETMGKYAGYPKRTYNGSKFNGGYSDHFPVALIFTLKMVENPQ